MLRKSGVAVCSAIMDFLWVFVETHVHTKATHAHVHTHTVLSLLLMRQLLKCYARILL